MPGLYVFDLEFCYIQPLKLSFIAYYDDKCHQSLYYIVGYYYYRSYILSLTVTSSVLREVYELEFIYKYKHFHTVNPDMLAELWYGEVGSIVWVKLPN